MWRNFDKFFNSVFFQTIIMFTVGCFVFFEYRRNNRDKIKNAASMIMTEVSRANRKTSEVKSQFATNNSLPDYQISILPFNSWVTNKALLGKFFNQDELDSLESYYDYASLLDELISYNSKMFRNDAEQIRSDLHRKSYTLVNQFIEDRAKSSQQATANKEVTRDGIEKAYKTFYDQYMQHSLIYSPMKIANDAKKYLDSLPNVVNTSVTIKLTTLSQYGKLNRFHMFK